MSLVFSLIAALIATLVQQWVREYMHVFQRYGNPLKSTRLRQYLYEGVERWHMPRVARSVPGLVHVSLFLFFAGLCDSLLAVHTTVAVTTIIPIAICSFLYIFSMFAPAISPQSPFRSPFSGLIWYLKQKVHPRRYLDRASGGLLKAVSSNLSEGKMQLAMEEGDGRKGRDVRAIRWLIHNRTEDDEIESFVMAIPGAFTSKWGYDVWRKVSEVKPYEDMDLSIDHPTDGPQSGADLPISTPRHHRSQRTYHLLGLLRPLGRIFGIRIAHSADRDVTMTQSIPRLPIDSLALENPNAHGDTAIYDLCKRVRHLAGTCNNYSIFTDKELWLRRARGCVETAASLVFCADIKPELFGDLESVILQLSSTTTRDYREPGSDGLFIARLDCLSFAIIQRGLTNNDTIKLDACTAINALSRLGMEGDGGEPAHTSDDDDEENAIRNARRIDQDFENAKQFCICGLRDTFRPGGVETTEEQVKEVLARDHEDDISMLERIQEHITLASGGLLDIDRAIADVTFSFMIFASGLMQCVSGACFDDYKREVLIEETQFFGPTDHYSIFLPQLIFLHQRLRLLGSYSSKLRDIVNGQGNGAYQEILRSLGTLWESSRHIWTGIHRGHLMERQLWRLQDLRDGGGFGYWVELCFLAAQRILLIPLSPDAHSSLLLGMFRAVASNWRQHKHSIGTQRVILNIVCDIAIWGRGPVSNNIFPRYITDELLVLVENIVEGQSGSHIDEAMKELEDVINGQPANSWGADICRFRTEAVKVISRSNAPSTLIE